MTREDLMTQNINKKIQAELIAPRNKAEAAERELAELKRRMREPDDAMLKRMAEAVTPAKSQWWSLRQAWLAAVNHLLGGSENDA